MTDIIHYAGYNLSSAVSGNRKCVRKHQTIRPRPAASIDLLADFLEYSRTKIRLVFGFIIFAYIAADFIIFFGRNSPKVFRDISIKQKYRPNTV